MNNLHPDVPDREAERIADLPEHEDDSQWTWRWPGLPDPHRHNPFAVGVALVVMAAVGWGLCACVVLAMIGGFVK